MNTTSIQRIVIAGLLAAVLFGCASQPDTDEGDPVADFIAASELEPLDVVRFRNQWNHKRLNDHYVVLRSRGDYYLVEFRRRCRELDNIEVTPDLRREGNVLRPGIDTIRGCVIGNLFAIDKGQAEELEQLGKMP